MYRLLESNSKTYPRRSTSAKSLYNDSSSGPASLTSSSCYSNSSGSRRETTGSCRENKINRSNSERGISNSPPRLPYDEQQMDERQERLRMRRKLYDEYYPPDDDDDEQQPQEQQQQQQQSPLVQKESTDLDSSSNHTVMTRHSAPTAVATTTSAMQDQLELVTPRQHPAPLLYPPPVDMKQRRQSHKPWQTDVKLNRFSGSSASPGSNGSGSGGRPLTGSSSTQKSTLGWKQRMQARKAVFGNVAVPEQSYDEDDAHDVDEDDDEHDDQAIRDEAVQLLKDKGFTFQGILQHQYNDDLESVGGSVASRIAMGSPAFLSPAPSCISMESSSSSFGIEHQKKLRLEEIKSLREQILRHQALHHRKDSVDTIPGPSDPTATDLETEEQPFDQRISQKATIDQTPSSSLPKVVPNATPSEENQDAIKAWKVMKELKIRLLNVSTDDHVVIETMGRKGLDPPSSAKVFFDEKAFDRYKLRHAVEKRVSQVFTGDHHIVVNGVVQPRDVDNENQALVDDSMSSCSDDDDMENNDQHEEEHVPDIKSPVLRQRLSDSFTAFEALLQARRQAAMVDDWTECSMSVAETPTALNAPGMMPLGITPSHKSIHGDHDDEQSCWTEYTVETAKPEDANRRQSYSSTITNISGERRESSAFQLADLTKTVKKSNAQNQWADPFRQPGEAQLPLQRLRQDSDDQSYMELTVRDDNIMSPHQTETDEHSYTEMTVVDLSATQQQAGDDDRSFMEITVQDGRGNVKDLVSPGLTSPHLTNMLNSRMFADMELSNELRQRMAEEENNDSYPTITIGQDDDDMTQITFDNTMLETGSDMLDHHHHAVQYLDNSMKSNGNYRLATIDAPDLRSQHTEQTKDTTVSDDGSSHHDVASFKSCVSTESSQFVAELLRRDIWSPDSAVVLSALEKLEQEAVKGVNERSNIVRYGGLLAILRSMDMKPDQAPIQKAACSALEKMAIDATTQAAIREVGGIQAIANAMETHANDVGLQQIGCKALAALTRNRDDSSIRSLKEPFQAEGVVAIVAKGMAKHPDDAEVQVRAFGALANLCLDNEQRLRELKQVGGLAAMTMALQVPWANTTDHHEAISTLSILLRSLAQLDRT